MWPEDLFTIELGEPLDVQRFLGDLDSLLDFIVNSDQCRAVWANDDSTIALARASWNFEVRPILQQMIGQSMAGQNDSVLSDHGLTGRSAAYKLNALKNEFNAWFSPRKETQTVGPKMVRTLELSSTILGSVVDAIDSRFGGAVKEFLDVTATLASAHRGR